MEVRGWRSGKEEGKDRSTLLSVVLRLERISCFVCMTGIVKLLCCCGGKCDQEERGSMSEAPGSRGVIPGSGTDMDERRKEKKDEEKVIFCRVSYKTPRRHNKHISQV